MTGPTVAADWCAHARMYIPPAGAASAQSGVGSVVEIFMLEGSPFPHGISVCKGYIDWADDIGGGITPVWRVKT